MGSPGLCDHLPNGRLERGVYPWDLVWAASNCALRTRCATLFLRHCNPQPQLHQPKTKQRNRRSSQESTVYLWSELPCRAKQENNGCQAKDHCEIEARQEAHSIKWSLAPSCQKDRSGDQRPEDIRARAQHIDQRSLEHILLCPGFWQGTIGAKAFPRFVRAISE